VPPGPDELADVIQAVDPTTVYVVAVEPATSGVHVFLERLAGMVKYDLRMRDGRVNVRRLAAALGHREATVRTGLELLVAREGLRIVEADGVMLTLQAGGEPSLDFGNVESRLRHLLRETAAYRRHFRQAPVEALGISV
jgi:hypothetical protein